MAEKALILDFGGVISKTLFETHAETEAALGLKPGTLTWRGPFDPSTDPLWRDMQARKITERDYWLIRSRETGALVGEDWSDMQSFVKRARGADPDLVIRPEARAAIAKAKAAGCKLGILSNELDLFYGADFRDRLPLLKDFDVIVDATYTGILKPDPRAFAEVVEKLGIAPENGVFVDDQLKNIEGAIAFNLPHVEFDVAAPQKSYEMALAMLGIPV